MKQIRRNVFETNSSSTHSLTMCMQSDYDAWERGIVYLNKSHNWNSSSIYKDKQFVTKEEAIDILTKSKHPPKHDLTTLGKAELTDWLRDEEFYTYNNYDDDYLEYFESSFTTPNGDTVICFGQYGYDG